MTGHRSFGPVGVITRGTTNINRLRRCDRWVTAHPRVRALLRHADQPLAVDVGYGASHTTTCEWAGWLRTIRPDIAVTGLEISPERVLPPRDGVNFALGGFELAGLQPHLVRAFNVLRQYDVADVQAAWAEMASHLAPGGLIVEGTCDELGRRCAWLLIDDNGPISLTLAWDPFDIARPSEIAERLPKILIHCNVPGQPIYELLQAADAAWDQNAGWAPHGPRVRWRHAVAQLAEAGWPIERQHRRFRDNLLTIDWSAVAPVA